MHIIFTMDVYHYFNVFLPLLFVVFLTAILNYTMSVIIATVIIALFNINFFCIIILFVSFSYFVLLLSYIFRFSKDYSKANTQYRNIRKSLAMVPKLRIK